MSPVDVGVTTIHGCDIAKISATRVGELLVTDTTFGLESGNLSLELTRVGSAAFDGCTFLNDETSMVQSHPTDFSGRISFSDCSIRAAVIDFSESDAAQLDRCDIYAERLHLHGDFEMTRNDLTLYGTYAQLEIYEPNDGAAITLNNITFEADAPASGVRVAITHGKGHVVNAELNWWGPGIDEDDLETMIYHFLDGNTNAFVDYLPFRTAPFPSSGDLDGDGDVDTADFDAFEECLVVGEYDGFDCLPADFDDDGDVDCDDWVTFQEVWTGPPAGPPLSENCDCDPFLIASSIPADNSVDPRQDLSVTGITPQGYDEILVTFNCRPVDPSTSLVPTADSFWIETSGGYVPEIVSVEPDGSRSTRFVVQLSDPIPPGHWTTLRTDVIGPTGVPLSADADHITIGFLPGDVDRSRTASAAEVLHLIDILNGVTGNLSHLQTCDIDRSAACNATDVLRLIDLLNGSATTQPWLNASLPD